MSDDEDIPQEDLYFSRRAAFVPKVSAEEFESMSKLLNENKRKLPEKAKKGPPPTKRGKTGSAAKKYTPEPEAVLIEEDKEVVSPSPEVVLSAAVKRRLKKLQDQQASEMKLIEAANQEVLSAADSDSSLSEIEELNTSSSDNNVHAILTISYMSEISRLRCLEYEKFSAIFPRVASLFNLKASEMLLCLKEKNISVDDTPKSLNITLNDIIECIPYVAGKNANEEGEDTLKIVFQSNDSKEKIDLLVHKLEKMQDVMARYSEKRSIPLDKFSFEFDGEKIMGNETPEDLDMESGNCIDVKVLASSPKRTPRKRPPAPVITVDDDSITDCEISNGSTSSDILVLGVTPGYMGVASNVTVTTDATSSPRGRGRGRGRSRGRGRGRGRGASRRSRGVMEMCVIN